MANINPTRLNLINLKKRIVVARNGYGILKRKREVLVDRVPEAAQAVEGSSVRASTPWCSSRTPKTATVASTYVGNFELED